MYTYSIANPTLLGEVKHDCTLNPILDDQYKQVLLQRKLEAAHARRPVIRMEEIETNKGKLNMMSGGWGNVTNKMGGKMVVSSPLIFVLELGFAILRVNVVTGRGSRLGYRGAYSI